MLHDSILTYSDAKHEDITFRKTPLQWAVENHDIFSLIEFLRIEKQHHQELEHGLYCLKDQLNNDLNLNLAISQFTGLYDKKPWERKKESLPVLLPLFISFVMYCIDVKSDIQLSIIYHHNYTSQDAIEEKIDADQLHCSEWHDDPTDEMYGKAFRASTVFASSSLVTAFIIVLMPRFRKLCKKLWEKSPWRFYLLIPLCVCPPLFLFTVYVIYSYRHSTSPKKSKERDDVEEAEFLWNTVDTVEAGFEASGEILLQVWLLGSRIMELKNLGVQDFINGIFQWEGATDTHMSLAKVIFAVLSIMHGVGECYRVQKREAVWMFFDIIPIYASVLLLVCARVIAFSIYFSSVQASKGDETAIFFTIHIIAVFAIRLCFSRQWGQVMEDWKRNDGMKWREFIKKLLYEFGSACLSCLVYIELRPSPSEFEKKKIRRGEEDFMESVKEAQYNNTTFYTHFFFFLLVLVENVFLIAWEELKIGSPD